MSERTKKVSSLPQGGEFRCLAEKRLRNKETASVGARSDTDVRSLLHELQVHQIEMEMQNEELRRAQEATHEASEKYHDLFDFAPIGYFLWDHQGRILEINLSGAALLGLDRNAVLQKRFGQFVAMENRPAFADFCQRVLTAGTKQTCEIKILAGGQPLYVLVEGIAAQAPQGQERLCRAAVIDITELKRAVEARENEAKLRTLFEILPVGISILDEHRNIVDCNLALEQVLGISREGLLRGDYATRRYVGSDGSPMPLEDFPSARTVRGGEVVSDVEMGVVAEDGTTVWTSVSSAPLRVRGLGAVVVTRDITERKRAEEALQAAKQAAEASRAQYEQVVSMISDVVLALRGGWPGPVRRQLYLAGCGPAAWLASGHDRRRLRQVLRLRLSRGLAVRARGAVSGAKHGCEGDNRSISTVQTRRHDAVGQVQGLDLSPTGRARRQLWHHHRHHRVQGVTEFPPTGQSRHRSGQPRQERVPGQHEPRNPHTDDRHSRLRGPARWRGHVLPRVPEEHAVPAARDQPGGPQHDPAQRQTLLAVINDILDLSKIEAEKFQIEPTRCSPVQLVAEVVSLMRPQAAAKHLKLKTELSHPLPETVLTDPLRLRQVLVNLVGNAIKFTDHGEVRFAVRLNADEGLLGLCFDVTDTGIGMNEEQVGKLFKPFSQVDSSSTRKFGGTGLGLCISKRLAEALGGNIEVCSEPGKGSTFSVTIDPGPLDGMYMTQDTQEALLDRPPTTTVATPEKIALHGRILLAEDGLDNQQLITLLLRKAGAEVTAVENGQLAAEAALAARESGEPFDVILMDMQMPVMDGYEATRQLRKRSYTAAIVALTAHAMAKDCQKCLAAGCDDYLPKPFQHRALLEMVAKHITARTGDEPLVRDGAKPSAASGRMHNDVSDTSTSGDRSSTTTLPTFVYSHLTADPDIGELVEVFVKGMVDRIDALDAQAKSRNWNQLAESAHQIKGAAGYYGFDDITLYAARLEVAAQEAEEEQILLALDELLSLCRRVRSGKPQADEIPANTTVPVHRP